MSISKFHITGSNRAHFVSALAGVLLGTGAALAGDEVLGGNAVVPRNNIDGATGIMFFDLNNPVTAPGRIDAWRIYAGAHTGLGQVELNIYRPGSDTWVFVGASPLETVAWGQVNEFPLPEPILVQPGDLIGWWYPQGTLPSIVFDAEGHSLNNHNWPFDPITAPHTDIPNLFTTPWHGPWDNNPRTYSIQVVGSSCPADLATDGQLNFFDVQAFLSAFAAGDLGADFVADGTLNFFDVQAFLSAFAAGCP